MIRLVTDGVKNPLFLIIKILLRILLITAEKREKFGEYIHCRLIKTSKLMRLPSMTDILCTQKIIVFLFYHFCLIGSSVSNL